MTRWGWTLVALLIAGLSHSVVAQERSPAHDSTAVDSTGHDSTGRDSTVRDSAVIDSVSVLPPSIEIEPPSSTSPSGVESDRRSELPTLHAPGAWILRKDSLSLIEYHHAGDVFARHPGVHLHELGSFGQPLGMGLYGALPSNASVRVNGLLFDDRLQGMTNPFLLSTEDAATFTIHPQYQAFWHGEPGDVFAGEIVEKEWNAPRPVTRLRHTEAPYEYLYTDAMFTLNPSERDNLYVSGTRTTIGSSTNNAVRYANSLHESWNLRARYRRELSAAVTGRASLAYHDHITFLNGGILGTFDPSSVPALTYPGEDSDFATAAFDPKAADLINPTMETHRQRYSAQVGLQVRWTEDSSQATYMGVRMLSDVRRFRDALQEVRSDSLAVPSINLSDHWTLVQAFITHVSSLSWARLTLRGNVGRLGALKGGDNVLHSALDAEARGRLDLLLGSIALSGFAGLDFHHDQSSISIGAGAEFPLGPMTFWGGVSFSPRIRTLLETQYDAPLLRVNGDRSPDLDTYSIVEGGMRLGTTGLLMDVRGFARRENHFLLLQTEAYQDSVLGRSVLTLTGIPEGALLDIVGGSLDLRLTLRPLHLDQQVTYQRAVSGNPILEQIPVPDLRYSAALYYLGSLIAGTLDLKAGVQFLYRSSYQPLTLHPETGLFTFLSDFDSGMRNYTDMVRLDLFLFATIKQRATIHLVLHNVLDASYINTGFYPMHDRAFRLGVDWIFFD
ncbi:MAG: hypothetical protein JXA28_00790 [Bacteroidetes bacterium]|nr:hypothetical protein [Bacteroidota bacterium]